MSFLAKGHANKGYDHVWLTVQWVDIRFQRKKLSSCSRSWWCEKCLSLNPTAIQVGKKKTIEVPSIDLLFLGLWCQFLEARKSRENYRQPSRGVAHSPSGLLQTQKLPQSPCFFIISEETGLGHLVVNKKLNTNAACFSMSGGPHTAQRACPFPWQWWLKSLPHLLICHLIKHPDLVTFLMH